MRYLVLCCCLLLLWGCEQQSPSTPVAAKPAPAVARTSPQTVKLLREAVEPRRFELPSEALQIWRKYKASKPALVLFSIHPFLEPLDPAQRTEVADLLTNGSDADFYRRGSPARINPALSPLQTLSAALDAGLFAEVVWFFPTREELKDFSAENFQQQMSKAGFIGAEEKLQLQQEGVLEGSLRGVPLRIIHPSAALPEVKRPALVHVDLGYFQGLYKNEVSTPLYTLLRETALSLRDADFDTLAVSLSYSTEGGTYALETRFLITDLASLLREPALLDGDMPEAWRARREALYNRTMFQESKANELIAAAALKYPDDPATLFASLPLLFQQGRNEEAFTLLDRIVQLDKGYAEDYLALAETGAKKGRTEQSLTLLEKAAAIYPDNPYVRLFQIDLLMNSNRAQEARPIIEALQQRNLAEAKDPQLTAWLKELAEKTLPRSQEKTE